MKEAIDTRHIPVVTQEDFDTALRMVEDEGYDQQEVKELVAGKARKIEVDGLQQSAESLGRTGVRAAMKANAEVATLDSGNVLAAYSKGRRA